MRIVPGPLGDWPIGDHLRLHAQRTPHQRGCPEAVGMDRAIIDDADRSAFLAAHPFDRHQVRAQHRIGGRDADAAELESAGEAKRQVEPVRPGEQHTFDPIAAVPQLRVLDDLFAHARLVDARAQDAALQEQAVEIGVLMREGLADLVIDVAHPGHVAHQLAAPHDLAIASARHVPADAVEDHRSTLLDGTHRAPIAGLAGHRGLDGH